MEKALKAKWIEALRSGKYKQGRNVLRSSNDRFCCLGVLCDISGQGQWKGESCGCEAGYYYYERNGQPAESEGITLPVFVKHFANIEDKDQEVLMGMNDHDNISFDEIGDWIELNIKEDQ